MWNRKCFTILVAVLFALACAIGPAIADDEDLPPGPAGQSVDNPGNGGNPPGQDKDKDKDKDKDRGEAKIEWETSKSDISAALKGGEPATVYFRSTGDLKDIVVWLTPSLMPYVTVSPESFEEILANADDPYKITLTLTDGAKQTGAMGGTLHLRQLGDGVELGRTYSRPLGIKVKLGDTEDGDADDSDDPDETELEESSLAVTNSADFAEGVIAPLEIISIFGLGIGPEELFGPEYDEKGDLSDYVADVQVLFNGVAAPIIAVTENQINVAVPYSVAGESEVEIIVTYKDQVSLSVTVPVVEAVPAIYTLTGLGHGQAAAVNQNGVLNGPENPALPGQVITFFGTGIGLWEHDNHDGAIVTADDLPIPKKPVRVTIGGLEAQVAYVGGAPGMVNSVAQFNVWIPEGVEPGEAVPVKVWAESHMSKGTVTIVVGEPPAE